MLPRPATTLWSSSAAFRLVFLLAQERASIAASNALPSGSGPSPSISGSCSSAFARDDLHVAEAARIVESHGRAGRHVKHHMIVRAVLAARMMELARRGLAVVLEHAERAGHAEMHQQHVARGQVRQQIFGAAAEPGHGLPLQPGDKILLKRKAQVLAPGFDLDEMRRLPSRAAGRGARSRLREVRAWKTSFTLRG